MPKNWAQVKLEIFAPSLRLDRFVAYFRCRSPHPRKPIDTESQSHSIGTTQSYLFDNAAEELMFPAENELNTISEISTVVPSDFSVDMNIDSDCPSLPGEISPNPSEVFPPSLKTKRYQNRVDTIQKNLKKFYSEDCTSSQNSTGRHTCP
ncbi:unnamed protein product [Caenorhabditis bovis]|uniref:Uncharacterized protein n=1 Tax=Caenorhabditis bovis TaxID=2654633 RepID=A0A8S1E5W3_9PELO|nr:unnamed protein product [Caenorhabditis bovis]